MIDDEIVSNNPSFSIFQKLESIEEKSYRRSENEETRERMTEIPKKLHNLYKFLYL